MKKIILSLLFLIFTINSCDTVGAYTGNTFSGFLDFPTYENETNFELLPSYSGSLHYANYSNFYNITNNELLHIRYILVFILFFLIFYGSFYLVNSLILGGRK